MYPPNRSNPIPSSPYKSAAAATIAAKIFPPCCATSCAAPAALVAADAAAELAALLALEITDERLLDAEEPTDAALEDALAAAPVAVPLIDEPEVAVMELFPAAPAVEEHTAAVCVNVTPAGVQMPLAYLRVAVTGEMVR
jgi:hypothetical protein